MDEEALGANPEAFVSGYPKRTDLGARIIPPETADRNDPTVILGTRNLFAAGSHPTNRPADGRLGSGCGMTNGHG